VKSGLLHIWKHYEQVLDQSQNLTNNRHRKQDIESHTIHFHHSQLLTQLVTQLLTQLTQLFRFQITLIPPSAVEFSNPTHHGALEDDHKNRGIQIRRLE